MNGLAEVDVSQRLDTEGPNELPSETARGLPAIAFEVTREPVFLMLEAAGGVYLFS